MAGSLSPTEPAPASTPPSPSAWLSSPPTSISRNIYFVRSWERFWRIFVYLQIACSILVIGVAYADEQLDEKPGLRSTLGLACLVVGLLSLPSAWALRDARQPADASTVSSNPLNEWWSAVSKSDSFRIVLLGNLLDQFGQNGSLIP